MGQHLQQNIEGEQIEVSDAAFAEIADLSRLRKIYKLNSQPRKGAANGTPSGGSEVEELQISILGVMALKGS